MLADMSTRLRIIRTLPPTPAGPVFEAAEVNDGKRWILWSGHSPDPNMPRGKAEGGPMWRTPLPSGVCLSDLPLPLPQADAAEIVAQVAGSLCALHQEGRSHGEVRAHRIGLNAQGAPLLLGTGTCPGTEDGDVTDLRTLHQALSSQPAPLAAGDADAIHQGLMDWLAEQPRTPSTVPSLVVKARTQVPDDARVINFSVSVREENVDEVAFDLGEDESVRGLLDPWTGGDTTSYRISEATGALSGSDADDGEHRAVLGQLAAEASSTPNPAPYAAAEGRPDGAIMALIADEALDPLPVPDSLPLPNPEWREPEATGEVTVSVPGTMDDVTVVSTIFEAEHTVTDLGQDPGTDAGPFDPTEDEDQANTRLRFWIFVAGVVMTVALATQWIRASFPVAP
jgi:hypothetical protein